MEITREKYENWVNVKYLATIKAHSEDLFLAIKDFSEIVDLFGACDNLDHSKPIYKGSIAMNYDTSAPKLELQGLYSNDIKQLLWSLSQQVGKYIKMSEEDFWDEVNKKYNELPKQEIIRIPMYRSWRDN